MKTRNSQAVIRYMRCLEFGAEIESLVHGL